MDACHQGTDPHNKRQMKKGGKFLKKLIDAALLGEYNRVILFYQLS